MKRSLALVLVILVSACSGGDATEGSVDDGEAVTTTAAPAGTEATTTTTTQAAEDGETGIDLGGSWEAELTQVGNTGVCPPMPDQRGAVALDQTGSTFTLVFGEDFDCDPAEACQFEGTIDGSELSATNGGIADSEGGVYLSSFVVVAESADRIAGPGESSYTLDDMVCTWSTRLVLSRVGG